MPRLGGFTALLADIFATADRVDRERANARAQASDARETMERIQDRGFVAKSFGNFGHKLRAMTKAVGEQAAQAHVDQRAHARARLAEIVAEANQLAADGKLSGEEAARVDGAIARAAEGLRQ